MDIEHLHLDANGQRFYVAAAGPKDGPLVMLLHGFPEMSFGWRHQLGPLAAEGFRVVAPDQRGYGHSSKPAGVSAYALDVLAQDIVALAAALGRQSARLVGHDWGGIVAWQLLTDRPAFVERAVILNAPHPATMLPLLVRRPWQAIRSTYIGAFQLPWLPEAALRAHDHALLAQAMQRSSRPGTFSEDELRVYREAWSLDGALTGMLNWYRAIPLAPSLGNRRVASPVRVIWGDRDIALDADLADMAMGRCDQGQVFHLRGASHWLHHEETARVNDLVLRFLQ
jgi:pimeloyl-ACP methyl ester carboxylesterase